MDVEQLMKLIDKVSESDLTGFKYVRKWYKLQLKEREPGDGNDCGMQAVTPEAVKVTGASSKQPQFIEEAYRNRRDI